MPKYLIQASYTTEGVQGLLSDGGSARTAAAETAAASLGGSVEAFYFAFGSDDAIVIADLESNADAAALSLAVSASGAVNARVTVLLTPEELDAAAETVRNSMSYSPPGSCPSGRRSGRLGVGALTAAAVVGDATEQFAQVTGAPLAPVLTGIQLVELELHLELL
ncbi:MAG: GYD domain-containing protein, partial [Acidimicrobiales bacterium]|nr:GYD domain-containing protein [Acidimicrobiales bacterium]